MKLTVFVIVCGMALSACGDKSAPVTSPPPLTQDAFLKLFHEGVLALEQHRFPDAAQDFEALVRSRPDSVACWINLASAQLNRNLTSTHQPCLDACERAEKLAPRAPQPFFVRGILFKHLGRMEEAEKNFRAALERAPEDPTTLYHLATIVADRDVTEATALLERAIAGESHLASAFYVLQGIKRRTAAQGREELLALFRAFDATETGHKADIIYNEMGPLGEAVRDAGTEMPASRPDAGTPFRAAGEPRKIDGRLLCLTEVQDRVALVLNGAKGLTIARARGTDFEGLSGAFEAGVVPTDVEFASSCDFDEDGKRDLLVGGAFGVRLLRFDGERFRDVKLPDEARASAVAATWSDLDQDADLDIVILGFSGEVTVLRNRRDGTFDVPRPTPMLESAPASRPASIELPRLAAAANRICAADLDSDGDPDLVFSGPAGLTVWRNDRLMRFVDVTARAGLSKLGDVRGFLVEDVNHDRAFDLLVLGSTGMRVFRQNTEGFARMTFAETERLTTLLGVSPTSFRIADCDSDGDIELAIIDSKSVKIWRGGPSSLLGGAESAQEIASNGASRLMIADIDGDRVPDLLMSGKGETWIQSGAPSPGMHALDVRLAGRIEPSKMRANTAGIGARVEVMAGLRYRVQELRAQDGVDIPGALPLHFGLASAGAADYVRVNWPDDVLQSEGPVPADQTKTIEEIQRKASSCPLLFAWDGERFSCVTDFLGVGGLGFFLEPGVYGPPDPSERVLIPVLKPRAGRMEIRIHEPFEEITYLDRLQMIAVDHPLDVDVVPDERFSVNAPQPSTLLLAIRGRLTPRAAQDTAGKDILASILFVDRQCASTKPDPRFLGYAEPSSFTFDFGDLLKRESGKDGLYLGLDGWVEYPYSHVNLAALQAGLRLEALSVDVEVDGKAFVPLLPEACYPAGMPRLMTLPLGALPTGLTGRIRLRTNQDLSIDRFFLFRPVDVPMSVHTLDPAAATLAFTGYPREYSPDGRMPRTYDYDFQDPSLNWKTLGGAFTKFGDVRELLTQEDDRYVVFGGGEEIALSFTPPPDPPAGQRRTWILDSFGWCKDMDPLTAYPSTVDPLPFRGMSNYPYRADERFPDDTAHREWLKTWQTRQLPGTRALR